MNRPETSPTPEPLENPRKIGKWARVYAQNRTLGVVVILVFFVIYWAAVVLGGMAYHQGMWILSGVCMAIVAVSLILILCFSVPRWGQKITTWLTERLYARDGNAVVAPPCTPGRRWIGGLLAGAFGTCILGSILLEAQGIISIPEAYRQPVSAIYCVPFLVALWWLQRPAGSPIALLWPALYVFHAILILAGAPILFTGPWESMNMLLPVAGYGILTGLVAHLYGRIALRRLRRAVQSPKIESAEEAPQP
jgi:hypothetical protein